MAFGTDVPDSSDPNSATQWIDNVPYHTPNELQPCVYGDVRCNPDLACVSDTAVTAIGTTIELSW